MKIFYSLPEMKKKGDAYILGVVRIAFWSFLFISSMTVFSGVRAFLSGYTSTLPWVVAALGMIIGFLAFSLAPDYVNARLARYVTRTILQGSFTDGRSIVILAFCGVLLLYLTGYSYKMSQFAAGANVTEMAGDADEQNVAAIDSVFLNKIDQTNNQLIKEQERIKVRFDKLVLEATADNEAKIRGEQIKIKGLEKNRSKGNTIWTDDQIRVHERRIATYRSRIAAAAAPIRAQEQNELAQIDARWAAKDSLLTQVYTSTRDTTLLSNTMNRNNHAAVTAFFKAQLSGIAGYAVFILIMLSIITEIIYERNEIQPEPVFSPFDFQPSAFLEALAMPFAWMGRHTTNRVRNIYNNLPELIEREDLNLLRYPETRQHIQKVKSSVSPAGGSPMEIMESLAGSMPLSSKTEEKVFYLKPESDQAETEGSLESTGKAAETAVNVIAQLKEKRRKIMTYCWKIRNPKQGGKKSTCIKNINRLNAESISMIQSFAESVSGHPETLKQFYSELIKNDIAKPGKAETEIIYINRLDTIE